MRPACIIRILLCVALSVTAAWPGDARAKEISPDFEMFVDPPLPRPKRALRMPDDQLALWKLALGRPDSDSQIMAAQTISDAFSKGYKKVANLRPELHRLLKADQTHPMARVAAARALIVIDDRESVADLWEALKRKDSGAAMRELVEPALADWGFEPIRETWRARLADSRVGRRDRLQAFSGLARALDTQSVPSLLEYVNDPGQSIDLRLGGARAAGAIVDAGLEADAGKLAAREGGEIIDRLCAIVLLSRHRSAAAQETLKKLAQDRDEPVAAAAMEQLLRIDPALMLEFAPAALRSPDANIRRRGVDAYLARPTVERVATLTRLLDDAHTGLREHVCGSLFDLAQQPELGPPIRTGALEVLAGEGWRGQERAALLLGALDEEQAAPRLVALLRSQRPEVMNATAWALKKLAVKESCPAILEWVKHQTAVCERGDFVPPPELHRQVAHLSEALGIMKYMPADLVLRKYIPRSGMYSVISRSAGIYAVGKLHENNQPRESRRFDEELHPVAEEMMQRLGDVQSSPPESNHVRYCCAVALGRMYAEPMKPFIEQVMGINNDMLGVENAVRWAYGKITGLELPWAPDLDRYYVEPFVEPLNPTLEKPAEQTE
ncbi:MAG: HEAT repeat domain-containing protein [Planctomycetaceae bacterium]